MKRITQALLALGLALVLNAHGQPLGRQIEVKPSGAYAEIDTKPLVAAMEQLLNGSPKGKREMAEEVIAHSDRYAPPVLFALSSELAGEGRRDEGMFWFYAGQLRTRFDINRCADQTVADIASLLTEKFGKSINSYAFKDPAKLKAVIQRVIEWDTRTPHNYDQRWINLHGMGAFVEGGQTSLSVDEKKWPDIAKSTREQYWAGYRLAVGDNPEDYFSDPKVVALVRAATSGDVAKADALVKAGADVNSLGKDQASPLWFAFLAGNRVGFSHLLDLGADPTCVFEAMGYSVLEMVLGRADDEYLMLMLDHKLDPNSTDRSGNPLLQQAASLGAFSKLKILVEHGAKVNSVNRSGETAITRASQQREYEMVLYLLDHGADPAVQDERGCDVASGLFLVPNLTAEGEAVRKQAVAKLAERGYRFNDRAIKHAAMILNLKEATGEEPPKWLKGVEGPNPAWLKKHAQGKSHAAE